MECLRPNSTYEFRIIARARDGRVSSPSAVSDIVQLRPSNKSGALHGVPAKPQPPEYVEFGNDDRVTLCWFPAASSLPIQVRLSAIGITKGKKEIDCVFSQIGLPSTEAFDW